MTNEEAHAEAMLAIGPSSCKRVFQAEVCSCGADIGSEDKASWHKYGKTLKEREVEALEAINRSLILIEHRYAIAQGRDPNLWHKAGTL